MSEKDKMLAGELYDANYDKELIKGRYKAKDICFEYNNLKPSDFESKDKIIKELFAKTGDQILVEQNFGVIMVIIFMLEKIFIWIIIV